MIKYRVVAFDLFGTLIRSWPPERDRQTMEGMAAVLSLPVDEFSRCWKQRADDRMTGAFDGYESCIASICSQLDVARPDDLIRRAAAVRMEQTRREMDPHEGAEEVLSRLKDSGYGTAVISNISMSGIPFWRVSPLSRLVDAAVMSCVMRTMKPDPRMYTTACTSLGVEPSDCLYVADGWDNELAGAAAVGLLPVLIRHPGSPVSDEGKNWKGIAIRSLRDVLALVSPEWSTESQAGRVHRTGLEND